MTVRELVHALVDFELDLPVVIRTQVGDNCNKEIVGLEKADVSSDDQAKTVVVRIIPSNVAKVT